MVSFVSKAFGGQVLDEVITQWSGFLAKGQAGDLILADRGFLIEEDVLGKEA